MVYSLPELHPPASPAATASLPGPNQFAIPSGLQSPAMRAALKTPKQKSQTFEQYFQGVRVMDARFTLTSDENDAVIAGRGRLVPGLGLDTQPKVGKDQALQSALAAMPAQKYAWDGNLSGKPEGELVIQVLDFSNPNSARLVYLFDLISLEPAQERRVVIDANTGQVLVNADLRQSEVIDFNQDYRDPTDTHIEQCSGYNSLGDLGKFICDVREGKYRLMGRGYPVSVKIIDARTPNPQAASGQSPDEMYVFTDNNDNHIFGENGEEEDRPGVDVLYNLRWPIFYFYEVFSWAGIDGIGKQGLIGYVRPLNEGMNPNTAAFYSSISKSITCNTKNTGCSDRQIVGHEFTHGVFDFTVHPNYLSKLDDMAALNESFADIFGYLTSETAAYSDGSCCEGLRGRENAPHTYKGWNYVMQEGCQDKGEYCMKLAEDTEFPCNAENYYCDVEHNNSHVQSFMFYLLTNGGAGTNDFKKAFLVDGIGSYKSNQIAFHVLREKYLPSNASYPDAREAWIAATEDLYGRDSKEVRSVTNAWHAVGIGEAYEEGHFLPIDGATNVEPWSARLSYEYPAGSGHAELEFQIALDENMSQGVQVLPASMSMLSAFQKSAVGVEIPLKPETHYYWRIRRKNSGSTDAKAMNSASILGAFAQLGNAVSDWFGVGPSDKQASGPTEEWGSVHEFTTARPSAQLVSPAMGAVEKSLNGITLTWQADRVGNSSSVKYHVQVAKDVTFNQLILEKDALNATTSLALQLTSTPEGYYWRVRPEMAGMDPGKYSSPGFFKVDLNAAKPILIMPTDSTPSVSYQAPVNFTWSKVNGAMGYSLSIRPASGGAAQGISLPLSAVTERTWTDPSFNGPAISYSGNFSTEGQGYCWKVQAMGANNAGGPFSEEKCYSVGPSAVTVTYPPNGNTVDETAPGVLPAVNFSWNAARIPWGVRLQLCEGSCPTVVSNYPSNQALPNNKLEVALPAGTTSYPFRRDLLQDGKQYQFVVYPLGHDGRTMQGNFNGFSGFLVKSLKDHNKPGEPTPPKDPGQTSCPAGQQKNAQGVCEDACKVPATPSLSPTYSVYDTISTANPQDLTVFVLDNDPFVSWSYQRYQWDPASLSWSSAGSGSNLPNPSMQITGSVEYYRIYYLAVKVKNQCGKESAAAGTYLRPIPPGETGFDPGIYPTPPSGAMQQRYEMPATLQAKQALQNSIAKLRMPRSFGSGKIEIRQSQASQPMNPLLPILQRTLR